MSEKSGVQRVGVVMAGGSGERFWPLSRKDRPKQLLHLTSENETMLAEAVSRVAPLIPVEHVYIVTGEHLVKPIREAGIGVPPENIWAEPCKRNTAGALAYAAAMLLAKYGDDAPLSMAVTTADHQIGDADLFCRTVDAALSAAEREPVLATMGIVPTRPETGYGYIQVADGTTSSRSAEIAVWPVKAFHEKPNQERAEDFIETGHYFWNSGMFFWRVSTFLDELTTASPAHAAAIRAMAAAQRKGDAPAVRAAFEEFEDISIDYALMERAKRVVMVRADYPWDDVGAWPALDRSFPKDNHGNVCIGDPVVVDSEDCIVYNEAGADRIAVSVVGAEDLVVVVTEDAVLVIPKDRAQDVRHAVQELKKRGAKQL
ncbi:MAG: mannose-1-phosphate guanylyltransferase [Candidatus Hydrogenedentes bacterium]|nr:mannose-1-phosphate guanylyltransferase [Candidatus Hydrogenedentota bacterium]